jgi:hypothetical protein
MASSVATTPAPSSVSISFNNRNRCARHCQPRAGLVIRRHPLGHGPEVIDDPVGADRPLERRLSDHHMVDRP